jgi:type IV secretion system protein VirB10
MRTFVLCLCLTTAAAAQEAAPTLQQRPNSANVAQPAATPGAAPDPAALSAGFTLPAGTRIPIVVKHAISTKNAKPNDPIYAETNFPVVQDGRVLVPVGTYVQGVITRVQRPGRVKGRGELLVHFNTLIFPNGYTVMLPGALDNVPGAEHSNVKDQEGTIQGDSNVGHDMATIGKTTAAGAGLGTVVGDASGHPYSGLGAGAGGGALVGLATVLLTRGPDLRVESGTTIEMVLERPVTIDRDRSRARY